MGGFLLKSRDSQLVRDVRDGSLGAFDDLMRRHQRVVFSVARSFADSKETALDMTQEVFLTAYEKLGSLRDPDQFKSWLIRITARRCLDWRRAKRLHDDFDERDIGDGTHDPLKGVETGERRALLARMLMGLNPKQRLTVVLKYLEGYSIMDISGVLQCSEDMVKNLLYRSVRRMATNGAFPQGGWR